MERKALPTEFKVSNDGRTVEGYASTFGNVDQVGDIVVAGAYKRTLNNNMGRIKVLRDHEHPIGMPVKAFEDSKGLYTESRISDTQLGNETLTLLRDGVLDRMSIGYEPVAKEMGQHEGKQVRYLKEIKLYEWSIVTFPANEQAAVTGIPMGCSWSRSTLIRPMLLLSVRLYAPATTMSPTWSTLPNVEA